MHGSQQIHLSATPDLVYEMVADLPRLGESSPECERVEWRDGATGPVAGAAFVGHNRGGRRRLVRWSRQGRVVVADPGREFTFLTEEGGRDSTVWTYCFEATDRGTNVTESYRVEWIPRWLRVVDVVTRRHRELNRAMRTTLERLKVTAESNRPRTEGPEERTGQT